LQNKIVLCKGKEGNKSMIFYTIYGKFIESSIAGVKNTEIES